MSTVQSQKLIVTIVHKNKARKVIDASKRAGARGGTTLFGSGIKTNEKKRILGIPVEREREIILTLVSNDVFPQVMEAIANAANLHAPKQGIGFVINTKKVAGICSLLGLNVESSKEGDSYAMSDQTIVYDLIVTIVNQGNSDKVVEASKKAGAEGGTILHGRGTGIHEKAMLFNILIEPEKEIVLTLITRDKTNHVLKAIEEEAELNKPGKGIAFVIEVEQTVGINHILNKMINEKWKE